MTPKQFIEKAIEGGWIPNQIKGQMNYGWNWKETPFGPRLELWDDVGGVYFLNTDNMLLDPLAWQAVGKVEGWGISIGMEESKQIPNTDHYTFKIKERFMWKENMHRMIDALCEGKSIEQFLENI